MRPMIRATRGRCSGGTKRLITTLAKFSSSAMKNAITRMRMTSILVEIRVKKISVSLEATSDSLPDVWLTIDAVERFFACCGDTRAT